MPSLFFDFLWQYRFERGLRCKKIISTLDYTNTGKMGDTDGPAFAVYSNIGYTGASATLDIANMESNTVLPNGKFVNGYAFFGIDVYLCQLAVIVL